MLVKEIMELLKKENEYVSCFPENEKNIPDLDVSGLSCDDRRCKTGDLFFCKGVGFDKKYLESAKDKGAVISVGETRYGDMAKDIGLPFITVSDVKKSMAVISAYFYGHPLGKMTTVAVTGTKGKTSTVNLIRSILENIPGSKPALISDYVPDNAPHLTTPEAPDFHYAASRAQKDGVTHLICEVSSQAGKEKRTYGVIFDYVCFLNFGKDHQSPSEHENVSDYLECKASFLTQCRRAVINKDTEVFGKLTDTASKSNVLENDPETKKPMIFTFSPSGNDSDFSVKEKLPTPEGSRFTVNEKGGYEFSFCLTNPGDFNITNALAAISVCRLLSVGYENIFPAVLCASCEGRQEYFTTSDGKITVLIDYAHNEMSFEAIFRTVSERYPGIPVTAIFGCPGKKAYQRRRDLPMVALKYCDRMIICEEDSGKESFDDIKNDILSNISGLPESKKASVTVIKDRETAIKTAVLNAFENGEKRIIVATGKGRENYMTSENGNRPIKDDVTAANEAISACNSRISVSDLGPEMKKLAGKKVAVLLGDPKATDNFLSDLLFLLDYGLSLTVICKKSCKGKIEDFCFKNGILCRNNVFPGIKAVRLLTGSGEMTNCTLSVIENEKPEYFAYISNDAEILVSGKPLKTSFSISSAKLILKNREEPVISFLSRAVSLGAKYAALIKPNGKGNFPFFLCRLPFDGTEIIDDSIT